VNNRRWFLVALGLLVWSFYARPVYELAWVAASRLAEKVSMHGAAQVYERPRQGIVDRAFEQGDEIDAYLAGLRAAATHEGTAAVDFSDPAAIARTSDALRARLRDSLRYPRDADRTPAGPAEEVSSTEDEIARYLELSIPVLPGIHSVGLLVRPKGVAPGMRLPLVIAAPGRAPAPVAAANGRVPVIRRSVRDLAWHALEHGYAVWMPSYVFYGRGGDDDFRDRLTVRAWQSGTSLPAIEIAKTIRSLDVLLQRADIDPERVAMMGFSYGGFYALNTAALDPRIRAVAIMGYFNDRLRVLEAAEPYGFLDWRFADSTALWLDPNVAALVVPRPMLVQSTTLDQLFPIDGARRAAQQAQEAYRKAGIPTRFSFQEFVGRHEPDAQRAVRFFDEQFGIRQAQPP